MVSTDALLGMKLVKQVLQFTFKLNLHWLLVSYHSLVNFKETLSKSGCPFLGLKVFNYDNFVSKPQWKTLKLISDDRYVNRMFDFDQISFL